jgi:hypothetical protein
MYRWRGRCYSRWGRPGRRRGARETWYMYTPRHDTAHTRRDTAHIHDATSRRARVRAHTARSAIYLPSFFFCLRGGVTGRPMFIPPYGYFAFFSAGLRICRVRVKRQHRSGTWMGDIRLWRDT